MTAALECIDLSKSFGNVPAVEAVSMSVERGAFVTLLGPSGCGKTTTLRLLAGFERPETGTIHINGVQVSGPSTFIPAEQRRVGMVFQDYALFPHLSVGENISFGVKGSKNDKHERVTQMLRLVGMDEYGRRLPHALSGGQQQRVALARALAPRPDILLLDEPFSNLDTALRTQVRTEVRQILRDTSTTAVFVTHDQEEALSLSDMIAVIFDGRMHQFGTPAEIYTRPANLTVAQFIGEANLIHADAHGNKASSPLGDVRLLSPAEGRVRLLIRPEMLHLHPADEGVRALILWREYYGHNQRVGIRLEDGTELVARTDTQVFYKRGETVRLNVYAPLLAYEAEGIQQAAIR